MRWCCSTYPLPCRSPSSPSWRWSRRHGIGILPNLAVVTYNGATSFPLLAIPLFILAGAIMNASGISRRLIAFASSLFGWIRGGLAHVSIGASMFFAEISGSAVADVAALGLDPDSRR